MALTTDELIPILYGRYFLAVLAMRRNFQQYLSDPKERSQIEDAQIGPLMFFSTKTGVAMGLMHGLLYVVIEGWNEAKLSDPEIDRLLTSPNVDLLRRFRNGMFHFQSEGFLSSKVTDFCGSPDCVVWVDTIIDRFQQYFLGEMKRINSKP